MSSVKPKPDGYHTITPYLTVAGADHLITFLERVFGAVTLGRHDRPDGRIMHAEVRIGDSPMMISEACDEMGPTPACLYIYVDDVDATYRAALEAGADSVMEPADMFWGDRFAAVKDACGNQWSIARHIEDVSAEEVARRAAAFAAEECGTNQT